MSAERDRIETDRLVEAVLDGRSGTSQLVRLRDALRTEVPAAVARRHLAQIQVAAASAGRAEARRRRRPFRVRAAVAGLAAASIVVAGSSSAIAMADGALPGDAFYGLKRAVERVGVAIHRDPGSRSEAHLRLAARRLEEAEALIAAGRGASEAYAEYGHALEAAEANSLEAHALGRDVEKLLAHIHAALAKHVERLAALLEKVPDRAQDAIEKAIQKAQNAKDRVGKGRLEKGNDDPGKGKPSEPPGRSGGAPGRK